jgi:predicted ribosome quality control (RQC) complex YloA/Tae2 family protein
MYLIRRRVRDLERQSLALGQFAQVLREKLTGTSISAVEKEPQDRIVRFVFGPQTLLAQLTGRTADLLLLAEGDQVEAALRTGIGRIGQIYNPPPIRQIPSPNNVPPTTSSPSEAADAYYTSLEQTKAFEARVAAARSQLLKSIRQKEKLKEHLQQDLTNHGDPNEHKRIGDLLLANISTAARAGNKVTVTDYYADGMPSVELEVDENVSLQDEAARRFRLYGKAKRAREEIAERMVQLDREIAQLERQLPQIEEIIVEKDEIKVPARKHTGAKLPGVRRYRSSDGYEVLVGRAARDNDNLTFKIAQPNDLWLHAGDYPGSHVVIRNPTRKEIPHRTIIEAAQLAGRFSQASEDTKVVIHYTHRKFLSKPKGAASGLVRLSRFRSITVEPKEGIPRITV